MAKRNLDTDEKIETAIEACKEIVKAAHPEYNETEIYSEAVKLFNERYHIVDEQS